MPRAEAFPQLRRYALHARYLWACGPQLCLLCVLLTVVSAGAGVASLVTTGRLIAALSRSDHSAVAWTIATAVSFVLVPVASSILAYTSRLVSARYLTIMCDATMEAGIHPYRITHLEMPRTAGELEAISGTTPRDWRFQPGIDAVWALLAIRLGGLGAFVILANWSWWAPVLLAGTWLVYSRAFGRWSSTMLDELLDLTGDDRRRASYLRDLLVGSSAAKEVRLFGLASMLLSRHITAWNNAQQAVWTNRTRSVKGAVVVLVAPITAGAIVLTALVIDVDRGAVSVGLLVTLVQAVSAIAAFGPHSDLQVGLAYILSSISRLDRIRSNEGLPHIPQAPAPIRTEPRTSSAEPVPATIELVDVTFTYPSAERPTLNGMSLAIPAGQSLALVGVNGAGKSTLIKLLCGLYRPDSGMIRVDGSDPGTDDAARGRLAVIFQDFVRYPLPLRDNIGVGIDQDALRRALRDAGIDEIVERLGLGLETVLSPEYDGGTDLSGGQWQRIALARALAALGTGAGALVLDEPTAALDIRAEAALFDRFLAAARGATTILVSHRLSSVRHAERIVVLADVGAGAHIVEDGDHAELLNANGLYAELFTLQASRFVRQEASR